MSDFLWRIKTILFNIFRNRFPFKVILDRENKNLKSLLAHIDIEGKRVVDLGVGTGNVLQFLKGADHVVGIDFTHSMLKVAGKNFPGVDLLQADALSIPLKSRSVDIITAVGLTEYLKDIIPMISETSRLLKQGGYLLLTYSPSNILTKLRVLLGHSICSRNLDQIESVARFYQFKIFRQDKSLMQCQVLFRKMTDDHNSP